MHRLILPIAVAVFLATQLAAAAKGKGSHDSDYVEEYYHRLRIGGVKHFPKGYQFYPPPGSYFHRFRGHAPPPPPPQESEVVPEPLESGSVEAGEDLPPPPAEMKTRSVKGFPEGKNDTESSSAEQ